MCYHEKWSGRMAASFMRSNAIGVIFMGPYQVLVYANKPVTLDDLKDNIQREITNVPVEMCARVVENWVQRIDRCKRARGGHMNDIEFHS